MLRAHSKDVRTLKEMQVGEKVMWAEQWDTGHIHRAYGMWPWHFRSQICHTTEPRPQREGMLGDEKPREGD